MPLGKFEDLPCPGESMAIYLISTNNGHYGKLKYNAVQLFHGT